MRRLEVIRSAITSLGCNTEMLTSPCRVSRSRLSEIMDCMACVVFPEYISSPRHCAPDLDGSAVLQRTLAHMADIMDSQMCSAFLLQSSAKRFEASLGYSKSSGKEEGGRGGQREIPDDSTNRVDSKAHHPAFERKAREITEKFLTEKLPHLRWLLRTDASMIFENDVAATSHSEVILCYPGLFCMLYQRTAHALYQLGAPNNFTRLLTEMAHSVTGIDIHPCASIGHHFYIDHGTGIVIGATAIIGNYVSIYQGVTLGARSFPVNSVTGEKIRNLPRHPIIEDGVTIYANAVVLGRVTVGKDSTIGGNCWVVQDLPPRSVIRQKSNKQLRGVDMLFHNDGSGI